MMRHRFTFRLTLLAALVGAATIVSAAGTPESFTREYRDLRSVEISAEMMDVEIVATAGNVVTVRVENIPRGVSISDRVRRGGVAVHVQGRSSWLDRDALRASITVGVPTGIELDITTSSGSIAVAGVQGRQSVRSSSGRISLENLGGEIVARTASGRITARDVVGTVFLESASGSVDITGCRGILSVETASGSIRGEGIQLTADASFRSASGSIRIDLDNAMEDLRYDLSTSSGRLRFGNVTGGNQLSGGSGRFLVSGRTASGSQEFL